MVTTIQIDEDLKERLDKTKVHHRETYNDLIVRLLDSSPRKQIDRESLIETVDVLSDPEMMRDIAEALEDYDKGRFIEI